VRTTLTIDDDIALMLERENHRKHEPMKQTINRMLRLGLSNATSSQKRKRIEVQPLDLGISAEKWQQWKGKSIHEILEEAEEPSLR
jgi:hypothetical protein